MSNNKELDPKTIQYIEKTDLRHRKSLGQYFTPKTLREELLKRLPKITNPKILDPANGTGEFLITAKKFFNKPKLHGWEIDKKLINISRKLVPEAQIKHVDSLKKNSKEKYDFVIGNPPYFEFKPDKEMREKYGHVLNGRANIYSIFVYKGIELLKNGGYLAYVVPPSMNNGAYFKKLREFIIQNCNIEYLSIQEATLFEGALQSVMLLILKKGKNKGDYIFRKNGILIFSEKVSDLNKAFENSVTLYDLGYKAKTGSLVWNQNKHLLTNSKSGSIPLIWSHNITKDGIVLNNNGKLQYARVNSYEEGPAIVTNRIVGRPGKGSLRAALIPQGMKFVAENHVNVIYPKKQRGLLYPRYYKITLRELLKQLNSSENTKILQGITGNTQISKNELEKLFPIKV